MDIQHVISHFKSKRKKERRYPRDGNIKTSFLRKRKKNEVQYKMTTKKQIRRTSYFISSSITPTNVTRK